MAASPGGEGDDAEIDRQIDIYLLSIYLSASPLGEGVEGGLAELDDAQPQPEPEAAPQRGDQLGQAQPGVEGLRDGDGLVQGDVHR